MSSVATHTETGKVRLVKEIEALLQGDLEALAVEGCTVKTADSAARLLFPGSFAPWHEGHRRIAEIGAGALGSPVAYELSIVNVDKSLLPAAEVVARLRQFPAKNRIWLTRAATFAEKADLFEGATFLVGADTVLRIGNPAYYQGSVGARDAALGRIADSGCRFLVFGRLVDRRFRVLSELDLPLALAGLCDEVPEERFRVDISSTEIRGLGGLPRARG